MIKVDSYHSLPLEKTMTFCNAIILVNSVWNKDKGYYYQNILLGKASYELSKKTSFCININSVLLDRVCIKISFVSCNIRNFSGFPFPEI